MRVVYYLNPSRKKVGTIFGNFFCIQRRIQRFFQDTVFSKGFYSKSSKGHDCELSIIIFSYKRVWMAWVWATYYGKCNYYVIIKCIRHCIMGKFIQDYFKVFSFLLIWNKNLRSPYLLTGSKIPLDTSLVF